ncbi:predicted protein [Naegleria gruberi]|uniref:Predicted protein n=1 Tax=Naegleria gruberi TaxID=5762 RepID=D2UYS9_NAEGR|nr:uncharacterized protein NAEGRDRAFT_61576 [Naegleria gruberi]EFC50534.1 predicted protein [Naegleria gruberi]|eukprot:XP_002683278.1 predicted protein [Naegleria gruberi strain NEG-M]
MSRLAKPSWLTKDFSKTFYDSQGLIEEDVSLLLGNYWLNDNIINFYYLFLENEKFREYCFVAPSVSFIISMVDDDEIKNTLHSLNAKDKKLVFFPVTDNTDISSSGGTHWSLLVFESNSGKFYYFDSMGSMNKSAAKYLASKVAPYFGVKASNLHIAKAPQQKNGYDCGIYVLAMSEYIAEHGLSDAQIESEITPSKATQLRKVILDLIEKKSQEE